MGLIITIGGSPGSGKSTLNKMLAAKLGIPCFGMGDLRRKFALSHGMSIEELNKQAEVDSASDKLADEFLTSLPKQYESFVCDGRTAYHFIPQSIKIYVKTDVHTAAERIFALKRESEHWKTIEDGVRALTQREESDQRRYKKLYDIDPTDLSQYDLVLDSTKMQPEELLGNVLDFLRNKGIIAA